MKEMQDELQQTIIVLARRIRQQVERGLIGEEVSELAKSTAILTNATNNIGMKF